MNKFIRFFLSLQLTCLVLFNCSTPAAAQSGAPYSVIQSDARYSDVIAQAQNLVREHMTKIGIPGATIAALVEGQIVWAEGFGLADVENRLPVWPSTKMRIGSVSKSLTSAAVGLLIEQGKLDLDAEVQKYVPSFPKKKYPITTRQVAGHLAGIRHYKADEFLNSKHYDTVLKGLTIFADDPLLFQPGEKYSYSSYGWNLVSAIVERAAKQNFLSYMQEKVFRPLGMRSTVADQPANIIYNRTRFYVRDENNKLINAPFVDNSYKWAGGGYLSTAEDLVRFGDAIINSNFLKPETVEILFKSLKTNSGEETNYGLGWRSSELEGRRAVGHGGGSIGGSSYLIMLPEEKTVVAVICNLSRGNWGEPAKEILELFASHKSLSVE